MAARKVPHFGPTTLDRAPQCTDSSTDAPQRRNAAGTRSARAGCVESVVTGTMAPKKPPAPKPMDKVTVEVLGETIEVEIILPGWAKDDPELWELERIEKATEKGTKMLIERKQNEIKEEGAKRVKALEAAFAVFDEDGSGTLSTNEVLKVLTRMTSSGSELTKQDADDFIKEFDRNGDGVLSINEFITAMGVMSDAYDGDGDGVADIKDGDGAYDGKEEDFATALAEGKTLNVVGVEAGNIGTAVEDASRLQK